MGCALAYELSQQGISDVILCEKDYLTAGSTGRCGAGVRQQWGLEMNIRLARGSCKILETLQENLGYPYDIEFKQQGYLMLAFDSDTMRQFEKNVRLQNELGTPSVLLTPIEAQKHVPHLCIDRLVGAAFCREDGHANPFHTTHAYAYAARRAGVDIRTQTRVQNIDVVDGRVRGVMTDRGYIETPMVFNAAGAYSGQVARMVGISLPVYTERHQILVTEPINRMQGPMVVSLSHHLYCQQTPHGAFVLGLGDPSEPRGINHEATWQFLESAAVRVLDIMPSLAPLRVVRQWSGGYNITPDSQPILGGAPGLTGYAMAVGFSGHGFMVAPMTARLMAQSLTGQEPELSIDLLDMGRFDRGELILEPSVV